ncbi:MAG: hypothetical protein PHQ67_07260 [Fermentimonas sp.]|nr:hypothetical protein [Fermentimonas sp.]
MNDIDDYEITNTGYGIAPYVRLEEAKYIRNIILTEVSVHETEFGDYYMAAYRTDDGGVGFIRLPPKFFLEFSVVSSSGRALNPNLRDTKIWVGKRTFITASGEKRSIFEWGCEF